MSPYLIDSHCHPPPLRANDETHPPEWLERARQSGVRGFIAVGTQLDDWSDHRTLATHFPGEIHWTAGLHPCYAAEDFEESLQALPSFLDLAADHAPCALGEIGLDFTRLPKDDRESQIERQKMAFVQQLQMAAERQLPVIIHSRGTVPECLAILRETNFPTERTLFHCFSEGPDTLAQLQAAGAKCSFTGIITFKNAREVRLALAANGLANLILETDSPYLAPEPCRGQRNEPAHTATLARYCADFFGVDLNQITAISCRNTRRFFGLGE